MSYFPPVSRAGIPTVSDDSTKGFFPGSLWIDTTTNLVYSCVSAAVGAAVWKRV